ncbi:MAG: hypothetical protein EBY49_03835 [Actinobacteria bacterium]|nr:hypothetical protein [Actinomycetota bacterium]
MTRQRLLVIGWREWVTLSGLECPTPIKAKIDTGAATSALHASKLERFEIDGHPWVRFTVRPHQRRTGGATASAYRRHAPKERERPRAQGAGSSPASTRASM